MPEPTGPGAMRRPTVLHVLEALTSGVSRHVVDLVRNVDIVDHVVAAPAVRVGSVPDPFALDHLRAAGAVVHRLEMRRSPAHPRNLLAAAQLTRLVRRYRPQILHGHSAIGGALARGIPAPRETAHVYTPHGLHRDPFSNLIEGVLARRTDRFVAVSPSEAELFAGLGVPAERVVVIPNGIADPTGTAAEAADLRALAGFPPGVPLVGCVARLLAQKAPERFVECCRIVAKADPEVRFLLIGDGPLAGQVDELAGCAELKGRFVRLREVHPAAPTLGQLDVFVLLSRFEGAPYTPLEAAWSGTPLVLSDCVGSVDVLTGPLARWLVPDGAPAAAAALVLELLGDAEQRRRAGEAAARHVKDRFGVRQMAVKYAALYADLT